MIKIRHKISGAEIEVERTHYLNVLSRNGYEAIPIYTGVQDYIDGGGFKEVTELVLELQREVDKKKAKVQMRRVPASNKKSIPIKKRI